MNQWEEAEKWLKAQEPPTRTSIPTFIPWQGEPASSDQIKRWIGDQRFIGDQLTDGKVTHSVIQGRVELFDGRELDAWTIAPLSKIVPFLDKDGKLSFITERQYGATTFLKPRINREPSSNPE